jgi:hypothetical protein
MDYINTFAYKIEVEELVNKEPAIFKNFLKRPRIAEAFHAVTNRVAEIITPNFGVERFLIEKEMDEGFLLQNGTVIGTGKVFKKVMKGSTELLLGMGTLGHQIDEQIDLLGKTDQMQAVIMDAIGSYIIGAISREVSNKYMDQIVREGRYHSIILSPGATEWDIQDQQKFFQLLDPIRLKMQLSDSMLMIPTKSVSFAIGIGPQMYEIHDMERCVFCPRKDTCDGYRTYSKKAPNTSTAHSQTNSVIS